MRALVVGIVALALPAYADDAASVAGTAAGATAIEPAIVTWTPPPIRSNAVFVGLPSLDGARGLQAGYERWVPEYRLGLGASAQLHESAIGDYTGVRAGIGVEVRWYWRARSFLHAQPDGSMIGWFTGGRFDIAGAWTHDIPDHRWLGSGVSFGLTGEVGYRFALSSSRRRPGSRCVATSICLAAYQRGPDLESHSVSKLAGCSKRAMTR